MDVATIEAIQTIPNEAWWPYRDGFVAETVHTMNNMKTAFRLIVFKRLKQGSLFEKDGGHYHVIASNRQESAEETMNWYHQRGEHSENRIKELKCDFAMERMPCGQFEANAMFFAIGVLATTCTSSSLARCFRNPGTTCVPEASGMPCMPWPGRW